MIIQIIEHFHDYEKQTYFVDTEKFKPENPLDQMVLKACKKKAFMQDIFVDVDKKRDSGENNEFWEEPSLSNCRVKVKKDQKPEKVIDLTLFFDC